MCLFVGAEEALFWGRILLMLSFKLFVEVKPLILRLIVILSLLLLHSPIDRRLIVFMLFRVSGARGSVHSFAFWLLLAARRLLRLFFHISKLN